MYLPIDGIEHQTVRFVVHSSNHYTKDTLHVTQNSENYYLCDCPQARPTRAIANLPTSLFSKCPSPPSSSLLTRKVVHALPFAILSDAARPTQLRIHIVSTMINYVDWRKLQPGCDMLWCFV